MVCAAGLARGAARAGRRAARAAAARCEQEGRGDERRARPTWLRTSFLSLPIWGSEERGLKLSGCFYRDSVASAVPSVRTRARPDSPRRANSSGRPRIRRRGYRRAVPTPLAEILAEADRLLEPERFEDYCVNGLQVPGPRARSRRSPPASPPTPSCSSAPRRAGADLLLVHHGLFWGSGRPGDRRDAHAPPEDPLRRGHRAGRLPPAARRAPRARQQRAARARARRRAHAAVRRRTAARRSASSRALPGDGGVDAAELFARVEQVTDARAARARRRAAARAAPGDRLGRRLGLSPRRPPRPARRRCSRASPPSASWRRARELGLHVIAAGHHATETFGDPRARRAARRALRARARLHRRAQPGLSARSRRAPGLPPSR